MNELWLFLPGILYLGIVTSYTDIRYGKIVNRDVIIGVIYSLLIYLGLLIYLVPTQHEFVADYAIQLGSNTIFAMTIAFGLWYYKVWSAGDGKLFFAFAMLVPLLVYQYEWYNWVPSMLLFFNIFIIGLFAMAVLILKNARPANYKSTFYDFIKYFFQPSTLFRNIVALFALFWIVQIILYFLGLGGNMLVEYFFTLWIMYKAPAISKPLNKYFTSLQNPHIVLFCIISVLRLIVDKSIYSISFLWSFALLIFVWRFFRGILRSGMSNLGKQIFSRNIPSKFLKQGMMPAENIARLKLSEEGDFKKIKKGIPGAVKKGGYAYFFSLDSSTEPYLDVEPEGLSKSQARKIRDLGFKKVSIMSTIPFAPIIFAAVLATLLLKRNILILARFLF